MWHIFFDLDLTLIVQRNTPQQLSRAQAKHIAQAKLSLYPPASGQPTTDALFSALYQPQHQQFLEAAASHNTHCRIYFLTASNYDEAAMRRLLNILFSNNNQQTSQTIDDAPFINRSYLKMLGAGQLDDYEESDADYAEAYMRSYAIAKTSYMKQIFLESDEESRQQMVLIDDDYFNRDVAFLRNFQIINPQEASYPILLRTLQRAIESNGSFFSFHNYEVDKKIAEVTINSSDAASSQT